MYTFISFFGRPFSPVYSLAMKLRSFLYQRGFFKSFKSSALVISVGNLTMGGTGKTPCVQMICNYLKQKGYIVAVVSRGYGGHLKEKVNLVSIGEKPLLLAEEAGDEPRLHAERLPGVVVATGAIRKYPCQYVVDKLGCNAIILDDGFQHLGMQRDVNLVLFDSTILAGNSRVFPGGVLREPVSALRRADAFILTSTTKANRERAERFADLLRKRFPPTPVFFSTYKCTSIKQLGSERAISIKQLPSPLYGFCGIAHPERFKNSLDELSLRLTGFTNFKDHQPYNSALISSLIDKAKKSGADALITTEKDLVKIKNPPSSFNIFSVVMEAEIEDSFWAYFDKKVTSP